MKKILELQSKHILLTGIISFFTLPLQLLTGIGTYQKVFVKGFFQKASESNDFLLSPSSEISAFVFVLFVFVITCMWNFILVKGVIKNIKMKS